MVTRSNRTSRSLTQREKVSYALERLTRNDVGFSREQAYGALGSLAGESGRGLDTRAKNSNDAGKGKHSIGIGQWNRERLDNLNAFAKTSKWGGVDDYRTQVDFIAHELNTTHRHVKDAVQGATTRYKAADVWTKKYEVPKKTHEFLSKRRANADYFANMATTGPKSPQEAADAAGHPGAPNRGYAGDESVTGAALSYAAEEPARSKGPFESLLGGVTNMLSGVANTYSKVDNAVTGVENKVTNAIDGDMDATSATPEKKEGGFFGETSGGAILGSLVGGYFGGPAGAVVGGLLGQGVNRGLTKMADQAQGDADVAQDGGMLGGVGRAIDGLFGGIGNAFGFDSSGSSESRSSSSGGNGKSWDRGGWNDGTSTSPSNSRSYGSKGGVGSGQGHVKGESSHG